MANYPGGGSQGTGSYFASPPAGSQGQQTRPPFSQTMSTSQQPQMSGTAPMMAVSGAAVGASTQPSTVGTTAGAGMLIYTLTIYTCYIKTDIL